MIGHFMKVQCFDAVNKYRDRLLDIIEFERKVDAIHSAP